MNSDLPKALHPLCGKPMLWFLLGKAKGLVAKKVIVVAGYRKKLIKNYLRRDDAQVVWQKELLGSGHAVNQTAKMLSRSSGSVLVLYCDTPLVSEQSISALLENHKTQNTDCSMLSVKLKDPSGYGRVKRGPFGEVQAIVEEGDCSETERSIDEINVGCYVFRAKKLFACLKAVQKNPKKKEYYLTDVVSLLARDGKVESFLARCEEEMLGVNTRKDLSHLQENMQKNILESFVEKGVTIRDPKSTVIDAGVVIGKDTAILPHTVIEGDSVIGKGCTIGPFARIRGGSVIGDGSVIGNFVEIVRSKVGKSTRIKHLSYIGDAEVGSFVNIGAGTITANYDGRAKYKTIIKDKAQIGSGTILVAPVTIGRSSKTGAGAVVTKGKNVKDGTVVVGVPARKLR